MQARSELFRRFQEAVHGADTVKLLLELYPLDLHKTSRPHVYRHRSFAAYAADEEAIGQTGTGSLND